MKIAHTNRGARVSLSDGERRSLGNPSQVTLEIEQDVIIVKPVSSGGYSPYKQRSDYATPWAISMGAKSIIHSLPKFGAETLDTRVKNDHTGVRLIAPMPKMDRPVQAKTYSGKRKKKETSPRPITELNEFLDREGFGKKETSPPEMTLEAAVLFINSVKEREGSKLVISVDGDGYLEVMTRIGR